MKPKVILVFLLLGTLFSCVHTDYTKKVEQMLMDYGDSLFVKSAYIDEAWKPEYQYALYLPADVASELNDKMAQYLARNPYHLNPKNTLVFSDADKNALNHIVGGFSIVNNVVGNLALKQSAKIDSLPNISRAVVVSIEQVTPQRSEKGCNYKLIRLDTIEAVVESLPLPVEMKNINREVVNSSCVDGKTFYKSKTLNNRTAFVGSSQLDDVWKPDYQYVLFIPEKAELSILSELVRTFTATKGTYSIQNTLFLCSKRFAEPVKAVIKGSEVIVVSDDIFESEKTLHIVEATIEHLEKKVEGEFCYKMERRTGHIGADGIPEKE